MHQVLSRWISRDPSHSGFASFSCSPSSLEVPQKFSCASSCCCTYGHPQTLVITHEQHDETAYNGWYYHRALQFTINDNSFCMLANNGLLFMNTQFTQKLIACFVGTFIFKKTQGWSIMDSKHQFGAMMVKYFKGEIYIK